MILLIRFQYIDITINVLFHIMNRLPLAISPAYQFQNEDKHDLKQYALLGSVEDTLAELNTVQ